jgi:DNA-directed RNA polymerase subunit N (RpoN/RPB10)
VKPRLRAYLPCPGNGCGGDLPVTLEDRLPEAPRVVVVPVRCRDCGAHVSLDHDWPEGLRLVAWSEAVAEAAKELERFGAVLREEAPV